MKMVTRSKILILLFLVISLGLNAQRNIRDGEDNWIVKFGSILTSSSPVNYLTQAPTPPGSEFLIVKSWDYTGLTLGAKTKVEMETYYDTEFYGHTTANGSDNIVETTLNGVLDTCLRARNWDDELSWPSGMWGTGGTEIVLFLDTSMRKAYSTYYVKLDTMWASNDDSKMSGFKTMKGNTSGCISDGTGPTPPYYPMLEHNGWLCRIQVKDAGTVDSYNYDRSDGVYPWDEWNCNPWSYHKPYSWDYVGGDTATYMYDDFITYGSWHRVDSYIKMNTWTGEIANRDGVYEVGIDGNIIFQMNGLRFHTLELDTNLIQGFSITQFQNFEWDGDDFHTYFDEVTVFIALDDTVTGENFHTTMWDSPLPIPTDDYYASETITDDADDVTIVSSSSWDSYMWTLDAGAAANTVTLSWNSGDVPSGCHVVCFDGNTAGAAMLKDYEAVSDMSTQADVTSTGPTMYVYLVGDNSGGVDLSGDVTFNEPFTIHYEWDFEDMPYGLSTKTHWRDYMVEDDVSGLDWAEDTIVDATIDGVTSKAAKIMNYSGTTGQAMQYWTFFDEAQTGLDKLMYSYHVRFDPGFEAISSNGKIPGILVNGNAYETNQDCPADSANGSTIGYLYKAGIRFSDYQYSHNEGPSCPWSTDQYESNVEFYFVPGAWYEITQYLVMNSSDGSSDGIQEIYVNGEMLFQQDTMRWRQNEFHHFDGLKFTFFQSAPSTTKTSSWTTDNHIVWEPNDDAIYDAGTTHGTSYIMETPITLSNRNFYYDYLVTTEDTITTPNYPSVESSGYTEAWLFDAGAGKSITATFLDGQKGSGDYIFFRDGKTTDDSIQDFHEGYTADLTDKFGGDGAVTSSGRDLYMYALSSEGTAFQKFRVKIEINSSYTCGIGGSVSDGVFDSLITDGYDINNLAVAGDFIDDQRGDWNALPSADKDTMDFVLSYIGINDCVVGEERDSASVCDSLVNMIADLDADASADCKIVLFSYHHCLGSTAVSEEDMEILKAVNTWIETVPAGVDYVSTANRDDLSDGDYLKEEYSTDGLHLNAAGELVVKQNFIDMFDMFWGQ